MRRTLVLLVMLAACQQDETVSAFIGDNKEFTLQTLNGIAFDTRATINFAETGRLQGDAPCNQYSAKISVPYPWIELGPIVSTKRACEDLAKETAYFEALSSMAFAEVSGPTLVLSNADGNEMVFQADP